MADTKVSIGIEFDEQSSKKAEKKIGAGFDRIGSYAAKVGKGIGSDMASSAEKGFAGLRGEIDASIKNEERLRDAVAETNRSLEAREKQFGQVSQNVAAFGDIESGARTIGGAIGAFGGAEVEKAVSTISEIPAVLEAIPRAGVQLGNVAVRIASMTPATAGLVAQGGAYIASMTGMSVATATMLAAAIPLAAAAAAAGAALYFLTKANNDAKEKAQDYAQQLKGQADVYADLTLALQAGDIQAAADQYNQLLENRSRDELRRERILQEQSALTAAVEEENAEKRRRQIAEVTTSFANMGLGNLAALAEEIGDAANTSEAEAKLKEFNAILNEITDGMDVTNAQIAEANAVFEQFGVSQEDLAKATEEAAEKEKELTTTREQAEQRLSALAQQESDLIARREETLQRQAQDRAIRDAREREDQIVRVSRHNEKLASIETDGQARIASAVKDGADARRKIEEKAGQATADAFKAFAEAQSKVREDAQQKETDAINKFNQDKARLEQDFRNREFDAVLANDIIAASRAERDFDQQQTQQATDFQTELTQMRAEANERLLELQAQHQQKLVEIAASVAAEIEANRKATAEKIANERMALQERVKAERDTWAEQEKDRIKREKRRAEDEELRDRREAEAFAEQLRQIDEKKKAEQQAIQASFDALKQNAEQLGQVTAQAGTQAVQQIGNAATQVVQQIGNAFAATIKGRQHGGRISANELFRGNEARPEYFRSDVSGKVYPLASSVPPNTPGMGGNSTVVLDFRGMTVGDVATGQMVRDVVKNAFRQVATIDVQVLGNALAGV